uniref:Uncharacterized protein n=1 Tax=Anguilla anguilla TaxID=7936 RepID=A0A0E9T1D3_ANGAN
MHNYNRFFSLKNCSLKNGIFTFGSTTLVCFVSNLD